MTPRRIDDVLRSRKDVSPFLVHLTRSHYDESMITARECLETIIESEKLYLGGNMFPKDSSSMSAAKYGIPRERLRRLKNYLEFISFTDTPLEDLHSLFDIAGREINLEPYGLVFLKNRLIRRGVSPVFYLNNSRGDKDEVVRALYSLIKTHKEAAAHILPLVATFGEMLKPEGGTPSKKSRPDFTWEREWRYAGSDLDFNSDDVFMGLCPKDEIEDFEKRFPPVKFFDPKNQKEYTRKIEYWKLKRSAELY